MSEYLAMMHGFHCYVLSRRVGSLYDEVCFNLKFGEGYFCLYLLVYGIWQEITYSFPAPIGIRQVCSHLPYKHLP